MIISKTPLRISFFGGGTDYPDYFNKYGQGAVLGTTIDKYVYSSISKFYSRLFDYSIRISYNKVECVNSIEEIQHSPFRECLRYHGVSGDIEVDYTAELPAYTGLGSSSSFIVGLLNSLHIFKGESISSMDLAKEAIKMERNILGEPVGYQDQTFAAVGGFNRITFDTDDKIMIESINADKTRIEEFEDHLMLFFTGIKRRASDIISKQLGQIDHNLENLAKIRRMVDKGSEILENSSALDEFGGLLDKSWKLKRTLSSSISNDMIDDIYERGIKSGAYGGKLLGAGGGGFILFFVPPSSKSALRKNLSSLTEIPIKLSFQGSRIISGTN